MSKDSNTKKDSNDKKEPNGKKISLAKYLLSRILLAIIISIMVYVCIYFFFTTKGFIPTGEGLNKTDWLSFFGAYLSFFGTVLVSLTIFWHTNYVSKQSEEKAATERKQRIQPVFSIEIGPQNTIMEKHSSFVDIGNKPERPSNVIIKIENTNEYPITNVIVFDMYIAPLLKPGEEVSVHCSYSDPTNTYKFYNSIAVIYETDYEKDISGLPKWFNINYDDVDGNEMYQSFVLHHFDDTPYYSSEGATEV